MAERAETAERAARAETAETAERAPGENDARAAAGAEPPLGEALRARLRHAVSLYARERSATAPGSAALAGLPRREEAPAAFAAPALPAAPPPLAEILSGEWVETDSGRVFRREEVFPLDHRHGRLPLGALLDERSADLEPLRRGSRGPASRLPGASRLGFFDVETTGTSGGTGTYIFLAGLGVFTPGGFRVRQYFLADPGEERAMLSLLLDDLAAVEGLVTYNGRTFDIPSLQTRTTLARLPSPCSALPHLDLLHVVRRLVRHRLPDCRLAEAEAKLLEVEREGDVPGWMVPSLYLDYLRASRIAPLRSVFRHNRDDILSLVGVLASAAGFFRLPEPDGADLAALGRWWEAASDLARAEAHYHDALEKLEDRDEWARVARRQALLLKRSGRRLEAGEIWRQLWERGDRRAGLELAMHLEHRARDPAAALEVARALLATPSPREHEPLERRRRRLERKLGRSAL
jgi:hypothetical protein